MKTYFGKSFEKDIKDTPQYNYWLYGLAALDLKTWGVGIKIGWYGFVWGFNFEVVVGPFNFELATERVHNYTDDELNALFPRWHLEETDEGNFKVERVDEEVQA
jgi:hypothetical protein